MKRTFKDFVQSDITAAFVNQDEFAEPVIINSEEMMIVRDADTVNPNKTSKQLATYDVLFHVASSYFEHIPQSEMLMEFEGEDYRIKSVSDNMGMLTIGLSRNEA